MKKLLIVAVGLCIMTLTPTDSFAIKIKIKGTGGIVQQGEDTKVCPIDGEPVCAEIEGTLWEFIEYIFSEPPPNVPVGTGEILPTTQSATTLTLTVYDEGTTTVYTATSATFSPGLSLLKTALAEYETHDGGAATFQLIE